MYDLFLVWNLRILNDPNKKWIRNDRVDKVAQDCINTRIRNNSKNITKNFIKTNKNKKRKRKKKKYKWVVKSLNNNNNNNNKKKKYMHNVFKIVNNINKDVIDKDKYSEVNTRKKWIIVLGYQVKVHLHVYHNERMVVWYIKYQHK